MKLINAEYVRDDIVEELLQRMIAAVGEVESEHEYITTNEIIIAGSKIGCMAIEEEDE
jgi:hypothetical protein